MKITVPYHIVAYRLLTCPIMYIGFGITFVGIMITYGLKEARRFKRDF